MAALGLLSGLLTLAVPVLLIVWAVRHAGHRTGGPRADAHSVRRFFQYLLLYGLLIVATVGVSDLLGLPLQEQSLAGDDSSLLARALTFVVFGLPMFVLLAAWSRRHLQSDPDEARSLGWAFYATVAPLTAVVVAMTTLQGVAATALAGQGADWPGLVHGAVWVAVWLAHLTVARRMLDDARRQGQLVLGALIGLGTSISGLVALLAAAVAALVLEPSTTVLANDPRALADAAATVAVGVPVWVVYWGRRFARARRTSLWFAYVLPVGVGGSSILAVVGASLTVYQVLVWTVGDPGSASAVQHFSGTPTAGACVVVGLLSWWYHRHVLVAAAPGRTEVTRVYEYLMSGIALSAAAVGVALVVVALIDALLPARVEIGAAVTNPLLAAVTLLVVGGPLWWAYWSHIGRVARATGTVELESPSRRVYLVVLFGIGGIAAVVSVLVAAFLAIQAVLRTGIDADVVRDLQIPVAVLLTTAVVSGYHGAVYRDDRSRLPAAGVRHGPRYVLLVGGPDDGIGRAVAHLTGARVDVWTRDDGTAVPWVVEDVVAAVEASPAEAITLVAGPSGLEIVGMHRM
ncbi:DUF5671 domain-containing protein [Cellulomonas sp. P24]|uniref:DUF5671 domain-containing protein n=1 Tax=Cellulomonas sp. P24 TaxID=2885206 RepID=UPI00216B42BB|nr:DUF5671 domain-containing protein [Cellulomonas sp. P24]MCR6494050.1 DUF5671 domain-containing protein [Cellulomonas sp. P24]